MGSVRNKPGAPAVEQARAILAVGDCVIFKHYNYGQDTGYGGFYFKKWRITGETRLSWIVGGKSGFKPVKVPKNSLAGTWTHQQIQAACVEYSRNYFPVHEAD